MCRAYGVLPHELPPQGTPERVYLEAEWNDYVAEMNDDDDSQPSSISEVMR
jgi:hypothetical protein